VSGNETSPGCFSTATGGGEVFAGSVVAVPPAELLVLFFAPAGRPRFLVDEEVFSAKGFAEVLLDSIIFELKLSVIINN